MIDRVEPADWRAFQTWTAQLLLECGVEAEVERTIETVRGSVSVDVWAQDTDATPAQTYLVECKHWSSRVPKSVVHAFRTVVGDAGASWGAVVSRSRFQRGAHEAAEYSNVRLLTWHEFQSLFEVRWFARTFLTRIAEHGYPLIEYTEPINVRVSREADKLATRGRNEFRRLREKHFALSTLVLLYSAPAQGPLQDLDRRPLLPLAESLDGHHRDFAKLAPAILEADSLRGLLDALMVATDVALSEFDEVFGRRV